MANRHREKRVRVGLEERLKDESKHYAHSIAEQSKKQKIYFDRAKKFESIKALKEKILKYDEYDNTSKRDEFLGYLLENQENSHSLLAKSLCDLAGKTKNNSFKITLLSMAMELDEVDTVTLNSYATALANAGDNQKAFEYFERSLNVDGDNTVTLNSYATALANAGDNQKAFEYFERSLKVNGDNTVTLNSYATALANAGDNQKAFEYFERSLNVDGDDTVTLNSYATALANAGDNQKAFEYFERSLNVDGDNTVTLSSYATALANAGDNQKAFEYFERSLNVDGDDTVTLNSYATALANAGDNQKAFEYFERSLNVDGDDTVTLNSYATALANAGDNQKAFEYFERSLNVDGDDTVTLNSYATALANAGENQKAFEYFERSLNVDGDDTVTLSSYATALANAGENQKAFEYFERSLKVDGDNIITVFSYGTALKNYRMYEKAINIFEEHIEKIVSPQEKKLFYLALGELYFKNKQQSIGRKYFDRFISMENDGAAAIMRVALKMLESNPYDISANEMLYKLAKESGAVSQRADRLLAITTPQEQFFKFFNAKPEFANQIETIKELNAAIYHKIENQLVILKDILDATEVSKANKELKEKLNKRVVNLFELIDKERNKERDAQTLDKVDYKKLVNIISQIAHNITDKVNNKLFVIGSELQLSDDGADAIFINFKNQIDILAATLNNLKDIEQGSIEPNFAVFDIKELLSNFSQNMKLGNTVIKFSIGDGTINSDKQKISEIINELIENSSRHNKDTPNVNVYISIKVINDPKILTEQKKGIYLVVEYSDDGRGIAPSRKEWIFNPLNTTAENSSGLGLFIIKRTVEKLRGRIFEDGENGARFKIFIPDKLNTQG